MQEATSQDDKESHAETCELLSHSSPNDSRLGKAALSFDQASTKKNIKKAHSQYEKAFFGIVADKDYRYLESDAARLVSVFLF